MYKEGAIPVVKIKISELLGKYRMTQKALSELTGIRQATISKMYYDEAKRVEIEQLNQICKVFQCPISDVLEYIPDEQEQ